MKGMTNMECRIAIASSDGVVVNQHFGKARQFIIVDVDKNNQQHFVENRILPPVCDGGDHSDHKMKMNIEQLVDCNYVLVSRIGRRAENMLNEYCITAYEIPGLITESVNKLLTYIEIQQMLS